MNGDNTNMNQVPVQNSVPTPNPAPASVEVTYKKSEVGPIIGIIIVLILIVLGGLYFWSKRNAQAPVVPAMQQDTESSELATDLLNVSVDNMDAELNAQ